MILATSCSSNFPLSVSHHHRHEEATNGAPNTLHAARTIEFANSSADVLVRLIVKGLEYNKLMLVVFESPAKFVQQQPVYHDKLVHAPGLKETRFCRCRLCGTSIRKDTIILNNLSMWTTNRMSHEERMCTELPLRPRWRQTQARDYIHRRHSASQRAPRIRALRRYRQGIPPRTRIQ